MILLASAASALACIAAASSAASREDRRCDCASCWCCCSIAGDAAPEPVPVPVPLPAPSNVLATVPTAGTVASLDVFADRTAVEGWGVRGGRPAIKDVRLLIPPPVEVDVDVE